MSDDLWYKNAVFYELNIRGFMDSNNDGRGDFKGIISRLDYLSDLGIDCIWLLPMYPSPGRDDGYDISDYCAIKKEYGNLKDFKKFLKEAHKRGIRVISDLVLNHTSDQHMWFKEARKGPDNPYHDYYVWTDDPDQYGDARIIFVDSETSNWSWCDSCHKYYWHRFFHHQPDLNFDNPKVQDEIINVVKFWLDLGLDGFRADAVPYLFEREGTNCENLPETHDYLKRIRKFMDDNYEGKILLAEANQWPEDLRPYFGDGDEFHMAFNFPLMPRIFMALKQEHHGPIIDIIKRIPEIPDNCQWAIFLRNHDELTLEMCTDKERDYMYREYATNTQMKINIGIRRRLAPLLDNDFRRIELIHAILFSLPGAPVIYYGDEIGMGDNIYLGDRDGVRTPMQWSDDKNAGFSKAKSSMLYAPVNNDPEYNYNAVNVDTQLNKPSSLLNFIKKWIYIRKRYSIFGNGKLVFVYPSNKQILVFYREHENRKILCVFNMSSKSQPVELELSELAEYQPLEILGDTLFPRIGELPYFLTIGPHGFFIFYLMEPEEQFVEQDNEAYPVNEIVDNVIDDTTKDNSTKDNE